MTIFEAVCAYTAPGIKYTSRARIGTSWFCAAQGMCSYVVLRKQIAEDEVGCVVPLYREPAIGTLRGILR
ncbi:MAG: hypothetical protein ACUVR2_11590 [Anaerolineae bacterium]